MKGHVPLAPEKWILALAVAVMGTVVGGFFGAPADAATTLQVTQEQVFLIPGAASKSFQIVEQLSVRNQAPSAQDVFVVLPAGYQSLQVDGGAAKQSALNGQTLTLSRAAAGGQTTKVVVSYNVPLDGQKGVLVTLHTPYPVYAAHLYLQEGNAALSAQNLFTTTRTVNIQGTAFRVFTRDGIPAGDDWTLSLQLLPQVTSAQSLHGLPILGAPESGPTNEIQAIGNLLVIAFVLAIGIIGIRSTQWGPGRAAASKEQSLYRAWEQVEFAHAQGRLDDATYETRRADLKRRLVELKGQTSTDGPAGTGGLPR